MHMLTCSCLTALVSSWRGKLRMICRKRGLYLSHAVARMKNTACTHTYRDAMCRMGVTNLAGKAVRINVRRHL